MNAINTGTDNFIARFYADTAIIANNKSNYHARKMTPEQSQI